MKKILTVTLCVILAFSIFGLSALASGGLYMQDPMTSDTFTSVEDDGYLDLVFKDGGGAWAYIMNPWNTENSVYLIVEPGEGYVQSLKVTFRVQGYDGGDEGYRVMGGFIANDSWHPSVWSLDADGEDGMNWEQIFGEKYYYYVDANGIYEIIISFRHAMDWYEENEDWEMEYVDMIRCIELGFFSPPEDTTMKVTIIDLEDTADIFTLEDISRPLGSDKFFIPMDDDPPGEIEPPLITLPGPVEPDDEQTPEPPTPEPPAPTPDAIASDGDGTDLWVWLAIGGGIAVAAVVVIIIMLKKKK